MLSVAGGATTDIIFVRSTDSVAATSVLIQKCNAKYKAADFALHVILTHMKFPDHLSTPLILTCDPN